ncbi:MAG TPA: transporter substrate-binding domain-containing protein, partial [Ktedonobacteraceae bacterium]
MIPEIDRRTFLKRMGQAGGLVVAGGTFESFLAACGGNVGSGATTPTPGVTPIGTAGLKNPGVIQWGADFVGGAPYVFKDPKNPANLVGFEVEIMKAVANTMNVTQQMVETCYGQLDQALAANKFDFVFNGWEITSERMKTQLFSDPYYRYSQQIVVRSDDPRFTQYNTTSDLALTFLNGMTVGTGSGFRAATILQGFPQITTKLYAPDLPFDDLKLKRIDAVFLDGPIVAYYVLGAGPGGIPDTTLKPIGKPLYPDVYIAGFNKSNPNAPTVLNELNQALARLKKDGTLKNIYMVWKMWDDQQAAIGIK